MLNFYLKVPNVEPLMLRLRTPIRDFTLLWPRMVTVLQDSVAAQFAGQGVGPHGARQKLEEKYAKQKARRYPGATILQADGTMESSFMGGRGFHFVSEPLRMEFGSDLAIPAYHQWGTSRGLVARRIFDLTEQDVRALRSETVRWIAEEYRNLGFRIAGLVPGETVRRVSRPEASRAGREAFAHGAVPI